MATTLTLAPAGGNYQLNDCILFCFNTDEVSDADTRIIFKYQLFCAEDDKPATKPKQFEPKTEGDFYIQGFNKEYRRLLSTPMVEELTSSPDLSSMKKDFYLKFWEQVIYLNDCDENGPKTETRGESKSSTYTIQNSVSQTWHNENLETNEATGGAIFTHRPECIQICKDGKDLIYICANDGDTATITQSAITTAGKVIEVVSTDVSDRVVCVGVSTWQTTYDILTAQGICLKGFLVSYEINGQKVRPDTYYNFKCCCEDHMTIYFKESGGGFAGMFFCKKESTQFGATSTTVCTYNGNATKAKTSAQTDRRRNAGNRILSKEGRERVTGSILIPTGKGNRRWVNDFIMSKEYYYLDCDEDGNEYLVKFIPDTTGATTSVKEQGDITITISGIIEQPYYQT